MNLSFYKNKRIFITGHTGFKGTWLCRILLIAGADITGYALNPPTEPSLFVLTDTEKEIRSVIADVIDTENLVRTVKEAKPDIIFHLAAQPLVRLSYKKPVETYSTNVMGTVNVLEAVRLCSTVKSFLNITTDKVYENKEWLWGYRENENLCGHDPYSNSKSCSELVTHSYKQSFFQNKDSPAISTARSGNVIGGGDYAPERIIPDCVRAAKNNEEILLRNPCSTRPYQHVLDCLSGYVLLAQKQYNDKKYEGAYNFGPDDTSCITTGELASLFCNKWGEGLSLKTDDAQSKNVVHEANFLKLDSEKARSVLDWRAHWTINTAVQKVVEWEKTVSAGTSFADTTDSQIKDYFNEV